MADRAGFHAFVRGRVQMVGFRFFTIMRAEDRGINGWVRNCRDGSVEVEAVGPRGALDHFLQDLRGGPPSARVTAVDVEWLSNPPDHRGFSVSHEF